MKDTKEFLQLANSMFNGLVQIDSDGWVVLWNTAAERITGYSSRQLVGKPFADKSPKHLSDDGKELQKDSAPLLMTIKDGRPREVFLSIQHADGYQIPVIIRTSPIKDEKGKIIGGVEIFTDNRHTIASFQNGQKTEDTVLIDPLTGIGNRPHIETKIRYALEDQRQKNRRFGILFVDIDHFKNFNDTHGHLAGDKILRVAANTLRHTLRLTDSCGRWGGEEFVAVVFDVDLEGVSKVAEKIRAAVAQTKVQENGSELSITISIGATLVKPEDTLKSLIERADRLMYKSKHSGRDRITVGD